MSPKKKIFLGRYLFRLLQGKKSNSDFPPSKPINPTAGILRASHRAIHPPTFDYLGMPWHRTNNVDVLWVAPGSDPPSERLDKPLELVFDLHPTSNIFDAGNRIRVTVACADKGNMGTPELSPVPTVSVYRGSKHASYITLPIIEGKSKGWYRHHHEDYDD